MSDKKSSRPRSDLDASRPLLSSHPMPQYAFTPVSPSLVPSRPQLFVGPPSILSSGGAGSDRNTGLSGTGSLMTGGGGYPVLAPKPLLTPSTPGDSSASGSSELFQSDDGSGGGTMTAAGARMMIPTKSVPSTAIGINDSPASASAAASPSSYQHSSALLQHASSPGANSDYYNSTGSTGSGGGRESSASILAALSNPAGAAASRTNRFTSIASGTPSATSSLSVDEHMSRGYRTFTLMYQSLYWLGFFTPTPQARAAMSYTRYGLYLCHLLMIWICVTCPLIWVILFSPRSAINVFVITASLPPIIAYPWARHFLSHPYFHEVIALAAERPHLVERLTIMIKVYIASGVFLSLLTDVIHGVFIPRSAYDDLFGFLLVSITFPIRFWIVMVPTLCFIVAHEQLSSEISRFDAQLQTFANFYRPGRPIRSVSTTASASASAASSVFMGGVTGGAAKEVASVSSSEPSLSTDFVVTQTLAFMRNMEAAGYHFIIYWMLFLIMYSVYALSVILFVLRAKYTDVVVWNDILYAMCLLGIFLTAAFSAARLSSVVSRMVELLSAPDVRRRLVRSADDAEKMSELTLYILMLHQRRQVGAKILGVTVSYRLIGYTLYVAVAGLAALANHYVN